MTIKQGSFGRVRVFEDFLGLGHANGAWTETGIAAVGALAMTSTNEGSIEHTVDEPGGIIKLTTDTADNDSVALYAGVFKPADGGCVMECRFKLASITTTPEIFVGFTETLSATTPVVPIEFDTATMTYIGAGGYGGFNFSASGSTADFRFQAGDGGAKASNADTNGTRAYEAPVADEWDTVRVEINTSGDVKGYLNGRLIKEVARAVTPTDIQHATFMLMNRAGAANVAEVDYFYAEGGRDWNA